MENFYLSLSNMWQFSVNIFINDPKLAASIVGLAALAVSLMAVLLSMIKPANYRVHYYENGLRKTQEFKATSYQAAINIMYRDFDVVESDIIRIDKIRYEND